MSTSTNDTPAWDADGERTLAGQFEDHIRWFRDEDGSPLGRLLARKVEDMRDEFARLGLATVAEYRLAMADDVIRTSPYADRLEGGGFDEGLDMAIYLLDDATEVGVDLAGRIHTSEELRALGGP